MYIFVVQWMKPKGLFHTCVKNNQLTLDGCHLGYIKRLGKKTIIHFVCNVKSKGLSSSVLVNFTQVDTLLRELA